jgi:hypothetical protein
MRTRSCALLAIAVSVNLGINVFADSRVKSKYTAADQSNETVVYTKGARQRLESAPGTAIINQNDLKRTVQIFDEKKIYLIVPTGTPSNLPASEPQGASTPAGGVVNYTVTITDTGEQRQMFGYTARHVRSVTVKEAPAGTCIPGNETIETDGWYIDYEPDGPAANSNSSGAGEVKNSCHDNSRYKQTGNGKLGYPLAYSLKTTRDGQTTTLAMEVVEFSTTTLDSALFDIPAGYSEFQTPSITAPRITPTNPSQPKTAGSIRVGVAELGNRTGKSFGNSARDELIAELLDAKVDAVPLQGTTPSEVEAAARKLECDYVAYAEVAELKKSSGGLGKFGGMLNKASSVAGAGAAPKEKIEAKIDYKLTSLSADKPLLTASSSGSNGGGFGVKNAIQLAATVGSFPMFMNAGMFNPNLMNALSGMNGMGAPGMPGMSAMSGMPRGGLDPGLSPFLAAMQTSQSLMAPAAPSEEGKAVSDALTEAAKKMSEALKKKK